LKSIVWKRKDTPHRSGRFDGWAQHQVPETTGGGNKRDAADPNRSTP
jgi:hypothetical protein